MKQANHRLHGSTPAMPWRRVLPLVALLLLAACGGPGDPAPIGVSLPQPMHWWPANGDTNDAVGNVDIAVMRGVYGVGWNGSDPAQRSWVFDGTGEYLHTHPVETVVPTDGPFTLSAWISPRTTSGIHTIVSQVGGQLRAGDFAMRVQAGDPNARLHLWRRTTTGSLAVEWVQSGFIVPRNAWTHVVAVYGSTGGGGNMQVYVNGNPVGGAVGNSTYTPSQPRPSTDVTMMRVASSELGETALGVGFRRFPFDGSIDELMVFDRALTASEVLSMYQNFALYTP